MRKNMILLGGRLLLFTVVAALALGGTFLLAREPIEQQKMEAAQSAQRAVLPEADTFEAMPVPDGYPLVTGLYAGKAGGDIIGYVLTAAPYGYAGPIPITMSVGIDGSIHGIQVGDLMETAGIGTKVAEAPFLGQYEALAADPAVIGSEVDITAGVTVTMVPFKQATQQMTALAKDALGIAPNPGAPKPAPLAGDDLLRQRQLPEALSFAEVSPFALVGDFDAIQQIHRGAAGRQTVGYTFELAPMGFAAPVVIRASIDVQTATVTAVSLVSQNDTPGFGTRLETQEGEAFFGQFAGKPVGDPLNGVDAISGVTVTSDAVKGGVAQAAAFYTLYLIPEADPDAGVVFEEIGLPTPDEYRAVQLAQRGVKDGAVMRYRFVARVSGYAVDYENGEPILMQIEVDAAGNFLSLIPIENPETPGIGNKPFEEPFTSQFLGRPATAETMNEVQAVSGATVTSEAVMRGLRQVMRAYRSIIEAGDPGEAEADGGIATEGIVFEDIGLPTPDEYRAVQSAQRGVKDGAVVRYRFVVRVSGYAVDYENGEPILMQVEVDAAGNFLSLAPLENPETPGIGNKPFEEPFTSQFLGRPATAQTMDEVQAVSGATVTSEAVVRGLRQAARAHQSIQSIAEAEDAVSSATSHDP
ncbi:MAG: FMN-binding protein [Clostridia bacterium]|nr:FMN-binding protein [Clostridia bacterium]